MQRMIPNPQPNSENLQVSRILLVRQWFSASPMLRSFNTVPRVGVAPTKKNIFVAIP